MRTLLPLILLWASLLVVGCRQHSNVSPVATAASTDSLPPPASTALDTYLQRFNNNKQLYRASTRQKTIRIQGRQGSRFVINTADLQTADGSPLADSIDITLMELHNQQQLLLANAPTVSDGKLLVSGGAVYIHLSSQGKAVQLKPGKAYKAAFPVLRQQNMRLFYGDTSKRTLNWVAAADSFRLPPSAPAEAEEQVVEDLIVSFELTGDTARMAMDTMSKSAYEKRKAAGRQEQVAAARQQARYERRKANRERRLEYSEMKMDKFEWINCDDFLEIPSNEQMTVIIGKPAQLIAEHRTYLVFQTINTVVVGSTSADSSLTSCEATFYNLPPGYRARALAVAVADNQLYAAISPHFRIGDTPPTLTLQPMTDQQYLQLTASLLPGRR